MAQLGEAAAAAGGRLVLEPLNRYETDLCNTLAQGGEVIERTGSDRIGLLADLFHMNIEEADVAASLVAAAPRLGHIHFVDSNRRPAGCGHLSYGPIAGGRARRRLPRLGGGGGIPVPRPGGGRAPLHQQLPRLPGGVNP